MTAGFSAPQIEQATVSALMQWPFQCFPKADQLSLTSGHFISPSNRILFDCARHQWRNGKPIELISFTELLSQQNLLKAAGGASYLTETWCMTCHSPSAFDYYLELLLEAHAKRAFIRTCAEQTRQARAPGADGPQVIDETIEQLEAIPRRIEREPSRHDCLMSMVNGIDEAKVIKTGLKNLDSDSPLRPRDFVLITGIRKTGKSILALSIVGNLLKNNPKMPILYFSLEDDAEEVWRRLAAGLSRVPIRPNLTANETKKLTDTIGFLDGTNLKVRHDCLDLSRIVAVAQEEHNRNKTELIVIDYAQLIRNTMVRKDGTREEEVASVSRSLRLLAMELNLPIILLSQLNKEGATRESRALEQDATACWEISKPQKKGEEETNTRFIGIPFQRNGASEIRFKVAFFGEIARVENLKQ